jgi:hypothetical protein
MMFSKEGIVAAKRVQNSLETVLEGQDEEETLFVPDIMNLNSDSWARLDNLSPTARENIRSVAFYVLSERFQPRYGSVFEVRFEDLASKVQRVMPYLEYIHLIIDTEQRFKSAPPPFRAWGSNHRKKLAVLPASSTEKQAWVSAYAEGHYVKSQLRDRIRYFKREQHESCGSLMSRTWTQSVSAPATSKSEDIGRQLRARVDIKLVEWAHQDETEVAEEYDAYSQAYLVKA